jgi:hypothetical protein
MTPEDMPTPSCVWRVSPDLIAALDERLGDPVDAYVNGSQTWLLENGPNGITLEWRLHPVASYERPKGTDTYQVFRRAADAELDPSRLWDGLEAFPAYADPTSPGDLRAAATAVLGREPDAWGRVDHDAIGDEWETTGGGMSIVERLLNQLGANPER